LKKIATYGVIYVVLQIVTGVEVAFLAVGLYFAADMPLPAALSLAIPIGLPLLIAQGAAAVAYHEGLFGKLRRARERRAIEESTVARAA